jgi:hypothetical protein
VQKSISTKNGTSGSQDTALPSDLASDGASFQGRLEIRVKGRITVLVRIS